MILGDAHRDHRPSAAGCVVRSGRSCTGNRDPSEIQLGQCCRFPRPNSQCSSGPTTLQLVGDSIGVGKVQLVNAVRSRRGRDGTKFQRCCTVVRRGGVQCSAQWHAVCK